MALAWKAGWVNALRGSNPLSSARNTISEPRKKPRDRDRFTSGTVPLHNCDRVLTAGDGDGRDYIAKGGP